jgi:hypothetical protein
MPATAPDNTESDVREKFSDLALCITCLELSGAARGPAMTRLELFYLQLVE